ncbi:MAG: protein kinase [Gemmataceae bacterium]|nr:protein kinase [Gemmataceae bacterium]
MTDRTATDDISALAATPVERPTVPGYEILAELGRGGMGVVYKARQLSANRLVALKLIRDSALAGPQERGRFRIEAQAAALMRHPNIVEVYEVSEHQGRPYFAMELVEGGSLDKHLAGQPLPALQAAELVRALAFAIQHAHEQKVVHRDLKPANILLQELTTETQRHREDKEWKKEEQESDNDRACSISSDASSSSLRLCVSVVQFVPKITDFGLAKRLDSDSTALTQDGAVLGTAAYMAPEQAAGRVRDIGPAVDIYALGAILYELLTGRPPFQGDSWNKMVEQVLHDEPARLRLEAPRDLETICLKCLEKEPGRRYASARDLANDLGRFIEGEPVAALPVSAKERLHRLAARDGYQILGEIGHGPRSMVYHALYGPLKQPVALKVFSEGISTREEWEDRMRRSAEMWAALAHPHIVPVQRAGWWDDAPYVAMEYVAQGSLAARPPFSGATAAETLEQVGTKDPAPLCERNPEVTPQLQSICLHCLRKNPWKRYHRAYDVMTRMHYLQDDPAGEGWRRRATKTDAG